MRSPTVAELAAALLAPALAARTQDFTVHVEARFEDQPYTDFRDTPTPFRSATRASRSASRAS